MMKTNHSTRCDCDQWQSDLALLAGGDLEDEAAQCRVQSHLTVCQQCQVHFSNLTQTLEVLQSAAVIVPSNSRTHVWASVAERLPANRRPSASERFNLWVPTTAIAAACAAMIFVTILQVDRMAPFSPQAVPQVQTVLGKPLERNLFVDDRDFALQRRPFKASPFSTSEMVPVHLPAPRTTPFPVDELTPAEMLRARDL